MTKTVEFKSNQGKVYTIDPKYKDCVSVSDLIRSMNKDGFKRSQIASSTGIRYQHVRNVLLTPLKKK